MSHSRVVGVSRLTQGRRSRRRPIGDTPFGNGAWSPDWGLFGTQSRESTYGRGSMTAWYRDSPDSLVFSTSAGPSNRATVSGRPTGSPAGNHYSPTWSGILRIDSSGTVKRIKAFHSKLIACGGITDGGRFDEDQWAFAGEAMLGSPLNPHAFRQGPPIPRIVGGQLTFFKTYGTYELSRDAQTVTEAGSAWPPSLTTHNVQSLSGGRSMQVEIGAGIWTTDPYGGISGFNNEFSIHSTTAGQEFLASDVGKRVLIEGKVYVIGARFSAEQSQTHFYDATIAAPSVAGEFQYPTTLDGAIRTVTITGLGGSLWTGGNRIHNVTVINGVVWRVILGSDGNRFGLFRDGTMVDEVVGYSWPSTTSDVVEMDGRVYWGWLGYDSATSKDVDGINSYSTSGGSKIVERFYKGSQLSSNGTGVPMMGGALVRFGKTILATTTGVLGYRDPKTRRWVPETVDTEAAWNVFGTAYNEYAPEGLFYHGGDAYLEFHNFRHQLVLPVTEDRLFSVCWYIGAPDAVNAYTDPFYDRPVGGDITTTFGPFPDRQMVMGWAGGTGLARNPRPGQRIFDPV